MDPYSIGVISRDRIVTLHREAHAHRLARGASHEERQTRTTGASGTPGTLSAAQRWTRVIARLSGVHAS